MPAVSSFRDQAKRELALRIRRDDEIEELTKRVSDLETEMDHLSEFIKWEQWERHVVVPSWVQCILDGKGAEIWIGK